MAYIGKQPVVGNFVKLDAIVTSATATYNLLNGGVAYFPQTANNCIVSLNGVIQSPTSAYTISGSTIVFDSALTSADSIDFILVLGDVLNIGTPSDSTVGFAKVTSNLITGATAETSIDGADSVLIYDDSATALRKMTKTNLFSGVANTPAFSSLRSTNQSVTQNVTTTITYDSEDFDTNSAFDIATGIFTAPSAGKYFFTATITTANTFSGTEFGTIVLKGSVTNNEAALRIAQQGTRIIGAISLVIDMAINDTMKLTLEHNSAAARNVGAARFAGYRLIGV